MSVRNLGRLGKFKDDSVLEEEMRRIRVQNPNRFSVKKMAEDLSIDNHRSSRIYWNILRNP